MKNLILSLVFGIMLIGMMGFVVAETTCEDSDGLDYSSAGETVVIMNGSGTLTVSDGCLSDITSLLESDTSGIVQTLVDNMVAEGLITNDMITNDNILLEGQCPSPLPADLNSPLLFNIAYECPNGCSEGACVEETPELIEPTCTESDSVVGGYFTKGVTSWKTAEGITGSAEDYCSGLNYLVESYCEGNEFKQREYECEFGCEDGACVAEVEDETENETNDDNGNGLGQTIRNRVKAGVYTNAAGDQIRVRELAQNRLRLQVGNGSVDCDCDQLNLTQEQVQNKTKFKVMLSNGRNAEVKIMPNVASATALTRLRLKVCNESRNCFIKLKEVGQGEKARLVYEARARKTFRIFGFIKNRAEVRTQIDAETGEEVETKRPWWAWMASEREE